MRIGGFVVQPIIGMEIHVQLATRTKMFCGCPLEFGAPPNSLTCPVCLGLPGALPVINAEAVDLAIRTGIALNGKISSTTRWDRKSYYYPDLPKNYQISQFDHPICYGGFFEVPCEGRILKVRIRRAHLEEDAGKNAHDFEGCTGVDLNRAGTPLLEIVTEPDLESAEQAREFAVQLHRLVRYLGVSNADMQKGQMRFEPNINLLLMREGESWRTPIVEVKNLNSFRSLYGAVNYEIHRQVEAFAQDGLTAQVGNKSNRGWDDGREVTVAQREKEEAHDYRYFPDPDLPAVRPDPARVAWLREHTPELPAPRTERFISEYKLPEKDAPALVDHHDSADLLDHAAEAGGDKVILGKHFLSFWSKLANERGCEIAQLGVTAASLAELANLVRDSVVNATAAAQIAGALADRPEIPPATLARELGLVQSNDRGEIEGWVATALAENDKAVRDARDNPKKRGAARGFLTGQVMKISGGKADPKVVGELIDELLANDEPP
ncbi:MAG: Asp-tRNA(Asn)/Glu-tRNA(Gln) amidotransferase subunit GatB [Phycisphaerales bacterium]|nr:Asp-tRNA(Asn)/Glu-tRNA(Gln) amidotransferase subunit GatB [Phycisphaerales bacterium]